MSNIEITRNKFLGKEYLHVVKDNKALSINEDIYTIDEMINDKDKLNHRIKIQEKKQYNRDLLKKIRGIQATYDAEINDIKNVRYRLNNKDYYIDIDKMISKEDRELFNFEYNITKRLEHNTVILLSLCKAIKEIH